MPAKQLIKSILRPIIGRRSKPKPVFWREWSIGIYAGRSPLDLEPLAGVSNPVLTRHHVTDAPAALVADPFMIRRGNRWHMFFEILNRNTRKGEIGVAESADAVHWDYRRIVLAEPFHLSYPYVFEWNGDCYMIPETAAAGGVRLYRASQFPYRWSLVKTLLQDPYLVDSSIFRHDGRWWLFAGTSPTKSHDTLRLFHADDLFGPWHEHPRSPLIQGDMRMARPAGKVLASEQELVRYAQDCYPVYGTGVRAFQITKLTTMEYKECESAYSPVLTPSGAGWNESGMHHVDAHPTDDGRWIAAVDGRLSMDKGIQG